MYGLNNKRINQKSGLFKVHYKSVFLDSLTSLSYTEKPDDNGDINFGHTIGSFKNSKDRNRGDFPLVRIEFIPNARSVHNKIADAKSNVRISEEKLETKW